MAAAPGYEVCSLSEPSFRFSLPQPVFALKALWLEAEFALNTYLLFFSSLKFDICICNILEKAQNAISDL